MPNTTSCEHCGNVVPLSTAERVVVESRAYYFCSESCKLQWGEQGEIEEEAD